MKKRTNVIKIGDINIGNKNSFVLIAGPCVIEEEKLTFKIAINIQKITQKLNIPFIFKASYDKANRTSIKSFRGPGIKKGLKILSKIKKELNIPVLSDVHSPDEAVEAAKVLDIIQIPAFLCRQTDLLIAAGRSMKVVNIKKGQFLAPEDMEQVVKKIEATGNKKILLTERGTSFGYHSLINDFRSLAIMSNTGYPVIFDATHSVQQPGGLGNATGGKSEFVPLLSRCAVAAGCAGIFMEVHPNPEKALSDGPNMLKLNKLEKLLICLKKIDRIIKSSS